MSAKGTTITNTGAFTKVDTIELNNEQHNEQHGVITYIRRK
jgi:hypothetical protein